ncbi:RNA endoribonuclease involved in mRNP quality control Swt1 [Schizosaccharomyces osmophilus]|uniref:RNA endoribonuclease involved in mRNP quality control Swt1 n=1 Tax=Schizosaccharomyces osmophilus TaxID=2545709 RepID=A0AAE9WIB7_9SCHI|nr:RNA endoribonuclease involved in mRNP quality control Swt1 [Schizosaccharomyces osmophilus]WBW75231.1 RNA endoribonuclease involved in mRNP quality control Swt1 [Schizosaccharomyces osmophilus]
MGVPTLLSHVEVNDPMEIDSIIDSINKDRSENKYASSRPPSLSQILPKLDSISFASPKAKEILRPQGLFIVDTNFLLSHLVLCQNLLEVLSRQFPHIVILLPWVVLQELDGLKSDTKASCGYLARQAHDFLLQCFRASLPNLRGQKLHERCSASESGDNAVLDCCVYFQDEKLTPVNLLSDDKNLCIKAAVHHVSSQSYSKTTDPISLVREAFPSIDVPVQSAELEHPRMEIDTSLAPTTQQKSLSFTENLQPSLAIDMPMDASRDKSTWGSRYAHFSAVQSQTQNSRPMSPSQYVPYTYTLLTKDQILHASHPRASKLIDQITKVLVEETAFLLSMNLTNLWGDYRLAMKKLLASSSFPPESIHDVANELYIHWYTCFDGYVPSGDRKFLKAKASKWDEWFMWAETGLGIGPRCQEEFTETILYWSNLWSIMSRKEVLEDKATEYVVFREENIEKWVQRSMRSAILS